MPRSRREFTQRTESVTIGDDGAMTMHVWVPEAGRGPGILLLQEIWGVGAYIRAVAERLAAAGYVVGAPDVFWRFAPGWAADHDEAGTAASFEQAGKLDGEQAVLDCVAACAHLGGLDEVDGKPGVLGFCLGGTLAFGVAVDDDPAVCVSYYGSGVPDMVDRLDAVSCPTLFHFGRDDSYIPADGVEALAAAMDGRSGRRAQRRGGRTRLRQPRERDLLRGVRGAGGVGEDDGVPH